MIRKANQDSKGFTLLEVLIALLIFSVGLLGLAGMQIQGLKFNHSAYQRSQATMLAYDMLDRIRSNSSGDYLLSLNTTALSLAGTNCTGTTVAACSADDMTIFDKFEWKTALSETLPKGNGQVEILGASGATPPRVIVSVKWLDDKDNPNATQEFFLSSSP